jgi:hypothetical protein
MGDDTEELSGWQLRVRELNQEQAQVAQPPSAPWRRRLAGGAVAVAVIGMLVLTAAAVSAAWPDGDPVPVQQPAASSSGSVELDADVVDAARECVAAGYGSADECTVGAVISQGG